MPFPEPQEPCDCSQRLNRCWSSQSSADTCSPISQPCHPRSLGGMNVPLPFLRGRVSVVSSFIYNLMPGFLLPSAHLSETFLLHRSDLFSVLSATLVGLKVSHPHLQLRFPAAAACANNRITFVLRASSCLSQHRADRKLRKPYLVWELTCLRHQF